MLGLLLLAELFAFAARNRVDALHLGASEVLPGGAPALAGFLQEAQDRDLRVSLALGRPVGLAVHCTSDPDNRTTRFCHRGSHALAKAMTEVDQRLAGRAGYGGLAVFTLEDWRDLGP